MSYLILVRHGKSEWNEKGLWTGFVDVALTDEGRNEALRAAKTLIGIPIDLAYTSLLHRAQETLSIILHELKLSVPVEKEFALNERDYGTFTGKDKWQVRKEVGEEKFQKIRRGWDYPIPSGESLKQVYDRVVPYYNRNIAPELSAGKNVLITASGNSLRALVKKLENISDDAIATIEIGTGEVWIYQLDENGLVIKKEIRAKNGARV